jgi:hypothetical protein
VRSGGGIGIHDGLRSRCRKACRFKSCPEHQRTDPLAWLTKAFTSAIPGNKADALNAVAKVREIMPESRDAIQGAQISGFCAYLLVVCGEKERGLEEIERLLHTPFGLNVYQLRGSVRLLKDDPRFNALLADPKNAPII